VLEVAVLLSVGRHPASGRALRADLDGRALELALGLDGIAHVHAIHAGDPAEPALRDYLGMGIAELTVLKAPDGDVADALAEYLEQLRPDVLLCGSRAERGESSGMLPYRLAHRLGSHLVVNAVSIAPDGDAARVIQALPRGGRRALRVALPLTLTVDRAAPAARMSAYGPARRGRIREIPVESIRSGAGAAPSLPPDWRERPARVRPRRLRTLAQGTAAERLRGAQAIRAGTGARVVGADAGQAARAIWQYLLDEGLAGEASAPASTSLQRDTGTR
jgi:electron transfer flavoprotein beta subunit